MHQGGEAKAGILYALYVQWADDNNEYKMSSTKFGREIMKRYERVKKRDGWYYLDISTDSISID